MKLVKRLVFNRAMKRAQARMTSKQREAWEKVKKDKDSLEKVLVYATGIAQAEATRLGVPIGKLGDGTLFDKLIAALPAILAFIEALARLL